jgi:hypothetical protein
VHATGVPLVHAPETQVSAVKHRFPVLQAVPSGASGLLHTPVAGLQVPAVVQGPVAVQVTGVPLAQVPATQVSPVKQRSPLVQAVPSGRAGLVQTPVAGLHTPATVHGPLATHTTGVPLVHAPAWQVSPSKQRLPVVQGVPLGSCGLVHAPVAGLHVPARVHGPLAVHTTAGPSVQTPDWQVSPVKHRLPVLHDVPFATGGLLH